ncbi:ROK family protein [Streptomyces sp. NPDC008343]|uniref:ROK family protein n=1 Tax=Streptomyces sp. NPDC008343 TaxID=3364828 RepID=UPI0036E65145
MPTHAQGAPLPSDARTSDGLTPVIEIGGTHVTAALVDCAAGLVRPETVRHAYLDAAAPAEDVLDPILRCARGLGDRTGAHWGVAVPGPFDYARGIARFAGVGKFDKLHGTDVRHALGIGLPAADQKFRFINDAHAFALGEWCAGAASGHGRVVGITLGTGVGSAFMVDGALVDHGPLVPPEGHVHLLTLAGRPLEETVSRRAILSRYAADRAVPPPTSHTDVREIAVRARAGEPAAQRTFRDTFHALGTALAPWLTRFHAEVVVVGGAISNAWDLVAPPMRDGLEHAGARPGIVLTRAQRPAEAALLGAARIATCARPDDTGFGER